MALTRTILLCLTTWSSRSHPALIPLQPGLQAILLLAFSLADRLLLPFVCCYYLPKGSVQKMIERSIRMSSSASVNQGPGCGQELPKLWSATQPDITRDAHAGGGFSKKSLTWSVPGHAVSSVPSWGRRVNLDLVSAQQPSLVWVAMEEPARAPLWVAQGKMNPGSLHM